MLIYSTAHRTRLAFLCKTEALLIVGDVCDLMGDELEWSEETKTQEKLRCLEFMRSFGGPVPLHTESTAVPVRFAATADILEILSQVAIEHGHKYITHDELTSVGEMLSHPFDENEHASCVAICDPLNTGNCNYVYTVL